MTTRIVTYTEGDGGIFSVTCAECPLKPHAEALGQKAPECTGGIATNMQGPVPLASCKYLEPGSFANTPDNEISIRCKWQKPEAE